MGYYVCSIGIVHNHTCCIWTVANIDVRHVEILTQEKIDSNLEQTNGIIDKVLAGTVPNCRAVLEGDVVKGYIDNIDEGQSNVYVSTGDHRACSSESQGSKALERSGWFCEGVCAFR